MGDSLGIELWNCVVKVNKGIVGPYKLFEGEKRGPNGVELWPSPPPAPGPGNVIFFLCYHVINVL